MSTPDEIRIKIKNLLAEKNIPMSEASIRIGKNHAYLQQFIVKGSPVRLPEEQRKRLALLLDIPEQELTDKDMSSLPLPSAIEGINVVADAITGLVSKFRNKKDIASIDMLDVTACCGNGIENLTENVAGQWVMPMPDFRQITMSAPENIKLLRVKGDSMNPTLKDGDWVMVDITRKAPDSDGLFLLLLANGLAVKRVQCGLGQNITVISDNPIYAPIPATLEEVPIAGKVIYTLKAEKVG